MPQIRLTDAAVQRLKSDKPQTDYWDTHSPGLGIRVSKKGTKTWCIRCRVLVNGQKKLKRFNLDRYPAMSLKKARETAGKAFDAAASGDNPADVIGPKKIEVKAEQSLNSFAAVRDEFLDKYRTRKNTKPKPRTLEEMRRTLTSDRLKGWKTRPLHEITKGDVIDILDGLIDEGKEARANTYLVHIRMMMNWAEGRGKIEIPPSDRIKPPGNEPSRERVLTTNEIKAVWNATLPSRKTECAVFGQIVRILLLTGQRRSEVSGMRWTELNLDTKTWEIPSTRTKNKLPQLVPLSEPVIEIINCQKETQKHLPEKVHKAITNSGLVLTCTGNPFSGWSRSKARLDGRAEITDWRLHDLRRTLVTGMNETLKTLPHVVEAVVNHVSGHKAGVADVYNRALYLDERKEALDLWANHIMEAVKK